jgi:hypothetical protein
MSRANLIAVATLALLGLTACRDYDMFLNMSTDLAGFDLSMVPSDASMNPNVDMAGCRSAHTPTAAYDGHLTDEMSFLLMIGSGQSAVLPVRAAAMGDFDGNAVPDLLALGDAPNGTNDGTNNEISFLQGFDSNGKRGYALSSIFSASNLGRFVTGADFDGAAPAELVFAGLEIQSTDFVTIGHLVNSSELSFLATLGVPGSITTLRVFDVDRDGQKDIVVAFNPYVNPAKSTVRVYWHGANTAAPWFDTTPKGYSEILLPASDLVFLELADLDNDCQPELVTAAASGALAIVDVASRTLAAEPLALPNWGNGIVGMTTGDFDGDGRDEIFVSLGSAGSSAQYVVRAQPKGMSPRLSANVLPLALTLMFTTAVDLNGDSIPDLVYFTSDGDVGSLRLAPGLQSATPFSMTNNPGSLPTVGQPPLIGDFTLGGKADVIFANGMVGNGLVMRTGL